MDRQSCPLILGSCKKNVFNVQLRFSRSFFFPDAYTSRQLLYQWQSEGSVDFVPGMTLSQFDLMSFAHRNFTLKRREGANILIMFYFYISSFRLYNIVGLIHFGCG